MFKMNLNKHLILTYKMLKYGEKRFINSIKLMLNRYLDKGRIPTLWKNLEVILLHKRGDRADTANYRPVSLLSHLYKFLTKIITIRLTKLDFFQPTEQAGFRKG